MIMPCPCRVDCPGTDSPIANLTSEAPDRLIFIGTNWGWDQNVPPLGWNFSSPGCLGICESTVSQEEADLCAARQQFECLPGNPGQPFPPGDGGGGGGGWTTPGNFLPSIFRNEAAFCTVLCADGLPFTYTVRAGIFSSFNQQQADEIAISYACKLANINSVCFGAITGACLNQNYLSVISVTGGFPPYSITRIGGVLPPGVGFVQDTATTAFLSGIPTATGAFTFTLLARDTKGNFMQKDFTCYVLDVSNKDTIPLPTVGTFYNFQLAGVGGVAPYTFSNAVGLPGGLVLQADGFIVGNPIAPIGTGFTCTMTDAGGHVCVFALTYTTGCAVFDTVLWPNPANIISTPALPNSYTFAQTFPTTHSVEANGTATMTVPGPNLSVNNTTPVIAVPSGGFTCHMTVTVKASTGQSLYEVVIQDPTFTTIYADTGVVVNPPLGTTVYSFTVPAGVPQIKAQYAVQIGGVLGVSGALDLRVDITT